MEQVQWLMANFEVIFGAVAAIVGGLVVLATYTPTQKDDQVLGKVQAVVSRIAQYLADKNK